MVGFCSEISHSKTSGGMPCLNDFKSFLCRYPHQIAPESDSRQVRAARTRCRKSTKRATDERGWISRSQPGSAALYLSIGFF